jgi:hypothetical protein
MAVERVREGENPGSVIASYGFCRTTIYKWLRMAKVAGVVFQLCARVKGRAVLPSLRRCKDGRSFVGSMERIHVNMALILVCGRVRSLPRWLLTGLELN